MEFEVGSVLEGKVTGITKFGAFVALPGGKSGLVHISEIAYSYVSDVKDFLTEGQEVKVKVINIDENGRINLSIKKATPPPAREDSRNSRGRSGGGRNDRGGDSRPARDRNPPAPPARVRTAASGAATAAAPPPRLRFRRRALPPLRIS